MRLRMLWCLLPLCGIACGCQNTGGEQGGEAAIMRIVIGFDETVNASDPDSELLSQLGSALDCELRPVQQIGGNAYVYNCVTSDDEASLTRKLDGLGQHKGVRYAEMDRRRTIQN